MKELALGFMIGLGWTGDGPGDPVTVAIPTLAPAATGVDYLIRVTRAGRLDLWLA
jgi:hypothetical protein